MLLLIGKIRRMFPPPHAPPTRKNQARVRNSFRLRIRFYEVKEGAIVAWRSSFANGLLRFWGGDTHAETADRRNGSSGADSCCLPDHDARSPCRITNSGGQAGTPVVGLALGKCKLWAKLMCLARQPVRGQAPIHSACHQSECLSAGHVPRSSVPNLPWPD